jgi:hypothetical protein
MVSADDPFAPGQVLDRISKMRELPVQSPVTVNVAASSSTLFGPKSP